MKIQKYLYGVAGLVLAASTMQQPLSTLAWAELTELGNDWPWRIRLERWYL